MSNPRVSVCLPVYNGAPFLAETIRSVLDQTFRDFELVVLDNASTDDSGAIARSFDDPRIRVESNPTTLPQGDNWNRAVELAKAPLVKLVCADDLLYPFCLERQVPPLTTDPTISLVSARRNMIDEHGKVLAPNRGLRGLIGAHTGVEVARRVVRYGANPLGEPNSVLFRRKDFDTIGGWRGDRRHVMDLDLWLRLLQVGQFLGIADTLAAFRIAAGSVSGTNDAELYQQQRELMDELAASNYFQVRETDVAIGRMNLPAGRAKRLALFAITKITR